MSWACPVETSWPSGLDSQDRLGFEFRFEQTFGGPVVWTVRTASGSNSDLSRHSVVQWFGQSELPGVRIPVRAVAFSYLS